MARFKPGTWLLALLSGISMSGANAFEKTEDGILLRFDGAAAGSTRLLQVTVCSDSIIRVTATPDPVFSPRQSLTVEKTRLSAASWSVKEEGPVVTLSTSSLRIRVDTGTAAVSFFDKAGRPVLAERPQGRTFTAAEALGEPVWKVRQI